MKKISRKEINLINEFCDNKLIKINWNKVSKYKLPNSFINRHAKCLNWKYVIKNNNITISLIKNNCANINWNEISNARGLSEKIIREFSDKVNWKNISSSQNLSEKFIREFSDKVNWRLISCSQKLSEKFIEEFSDKVDWDYISYSQNISKEFVLKFIKKFNNSSLKNLFNFKIKVPESTFDSYKEKLKINQVPTFSFKKHYKISYKTFI